MAGASQLEFREIYAETEATIRARLEADADPTIDKRAGEIFYDITTPAIKEMNRLWDAFNTMVSVTFLPWSFGVYLDYKGVNEIGLSRKAASLAVGVIKITGERDTQIPSGTTVGTSATQPTDPIYQFVTTVEDEIGMDDPAVAPTSVLGTGGAITNTVSYKVTFVGRGGETAPGPGSTPLVVTADRVELSAIPIGPSGTTSRKIWRQEGGSGDYTLLTTIANNTTTVYQDNSNADPASATVAPTDNTTDEVEIPIEATVTGSDHNVPAGAITTLVDQIDGVTSIINEDAIFEGSDVETDDEYSSRLREAVASPTGQGNKADYRIWATSVDGVEAVTVVSLWAGPNTVLVVLLGADNGPVSAEIIDQVQALLDPNENGDGSGLAPVGAEVTVQTATTVAIAIVADVLLEEFNTLDGVNSTTAVRSSIEAAITDYLQNLNPGDDVIWAEVLAAIVRTPGVIDVDNLTINAGTSNIAISNTQIPDLTTVTLTQL